MSVRPSSLLPRDLHAWLPWLLAATFVLAAEALGQHFALTPPEQTLLHAPVASSVILFFAIRRYWNHDRVAFECVSPGCFASAALRTPPPPRSSGAVRSAPDSPLVN